MWPLAIIYAAVLGFIYATGRPNTRRNMEYTQRLKELTTALEIERDRMEMYERLATDADSGLNDHRTALLWWDKFNVSTFRANQIINQIADL